MVLSSQRNALSCRHVIICTEGNPIVGVGNRSLCSIKTEAATGQALMQGSHFQGAAAPQRHPYFGGQEREFDDNINKADVVIQSSLDAATVDLRKAPDGTSLWVYSVCGSEGLRQEQGTHGNLCVLPDAVKAGDAQVYCVPGPVPYKAPAGL